MRNAYLRSANLTSAQCASAFTYFLRKQKQKW